MSRPSGTSHGAVVAYPSTRRRTERYYSESYAATFFAINMPVVTTSPLETTDGHFAKTGEGQYFS